MSRAMSDLLPCGHPAACVSTGDDGTSYCAWCEEVERLRAVRDAARQLRLQMGSPSLHSYNWAMVNLDAALGNEAEARDE